MKLSTLIEGGGRAAIANFGRCHQRRPWHPARRPNRSAGRKSRHPLRPGTCSAKPLTSRTAVDFAPCAGRGRRLRLERSGTFAVTISDDGPGFAPEVMDRIGEPYVTNRPPARRRWRGRAAWGLGFFHCQDLVGTLRRYARLQEPRIFRIAARSSSVRWGPQRGSNARVAFAS